MRLINTVADRLLSAIIPQTEAGACVPDHGYKWWEYCYCRYNRVFRQQCTVTCNGGQTCTTCARTGEPC